MSDSPAPQDLWDNPMGTDGFEFVEYTGPDPQQLGALCEQMGFVVAARHRSKNVTLYRQGDVNFSLNAEPESFAQPFARLHGPSVCAIAFRVKDAAAAYQRAVALGAKPVHGKLGPMELNIPAIEGIGGSLIYLVDRYGEHTIYDVDFVPLVAAKALPPARPAAIDPIGAIAFGVKAAAAAYQRAVALGAKPVHGKLGPMELNIPAIEGIGGSLIYLVDRYGEHTIYDVDFVPLVADKALPAAGLAAIDHLTHNVHRGRMALWAEFYERLFNFREIRYFDIEGRLTGLRSKAMTSPDGKIRIPINESADDKSQIAEYLAAYHGDGIQHIALAAGDIYRTIEAFPARDLAFMTLAETY